MRDSYIENVAFWIMLIEAIQLSWCGKSHDDVSRQPRLLRGNCVQRSRLLGTMRGMHAVQKRVGDMAERHRGRFLPSLCDVWEVLSAVYLSRRQAGHM